MRVLIVGLGSIGKKHVVALKALKQPVEIFALRSSLNADTVEGVTNIFDKNKVKSFKFSFCVIATPTSSHLSDIKFLISLEVPMFIEKPLFHSLEVAEVVREIEEKHLKSYVACNLRFLDSLVYLRKQLRDEECRINEVSIYCGSYLPNWRENKNFREIYSANAKMGGGVHLDLIHEIDYAYWIFGKPNKVIRALNSRSHLNIDSVDSATYILNYQFYSASITLNYFRRSPKRELEVVCEKGTYKVDLLLNSVSFEGEEVYVSNQSFLDTYQAQMNYFVESLESTNFNDVSEAFEVLKICIEK